MSTWFQPIPLTSGDAASWLKLTSENSFRVVSPAEIPEPLSKALLEKCDAVLVIRSGSNDKEYVVGNLYRREKGKIDEMPFGSVFVSGSAPAGLLTHHGDWDGRTFSGSNSPPSYYKLSEPSSGVYDRCFATLGLPAKESGSLDDLARDTNLAAFQRVVDEIRKTQA